MIIADRQQSGGVRPIEQSSLGVEYERTRSGQRATRDARRRKPRALRPEQSSSLGIQHVWPLKQELARKALYQEDSYLAKSLIFAEVLSGLWSHA